MPTYVHTLRDFTNSASLAWRLHRRISTVMFTCGLARSACSPIFGFWGSKVHKMGDSLPWMPVQNLTPLALSSAEKSRAHALPLLEPLVRYTSTDRVQAGCTDIQDLSFINPGVPRPSHQIASNFTLSSFFWHAFNAQAYYQNSLRWPSFLLHCPYSVEFA